MMISIETAPKDGQRIRLFRQKGDSYIGRWEEKESPFRKEKQWLSDEDKFIDVGINRVIGWKEL